ncbi:hypothetical protein CN953_28280, partial [Bacillus thuringiensis]
MNNELKYNIYELQQFIQKTYSDIK